MKPTNPKEIVADKNLIAYCGLYCGACRSYLAGKCPGCKENAKATWCKIRSCCMENNLKSCADCESIALKDCKKYNSFISKIIGIVLNSDRAACIDRIRVIGYPNFATEMASLKRQTLPRR
jgi:hypothetical protein